MRQIRIERTPVYWVFQLVIGLVRPFIVWLPVAAMTFLGGLYLHRCFEYLKDPEKPFVFHYTGAEGLITLKAARYSLIPFPLATKLEGVTLTDDQDHLIAGIDEATIRQSGKAFLIRGKKGYLDLTRDPSGMLSAQRLIPPANLDAKPTGVSAEVDEVTIRYRDETRDVPIEEEIEARDVAFSNSSQGFIAGLTVAHQAGEINLSVLQEFQSNLEIEFRTTNFDVAQILPTVERWVDRESIGVDPRATASSFFFDGSGHVVVPPSDSKQPPQIYAEGSFEGRGISYPGYVASASADGDFRYVDNIISGRIDIRDGATRAVFDGGIQFGEMVFARGQFDVSSPGVNSLPTSIRKLMPKDIGWRNLNAVGNVNWKGKESSVEAKISGNSLVAVGQKFDQPQGHLTFANNKLLAQIERVSFQQIPTSGWIGIDFGTEEITGKFDADSGSLLAKIPERVRDKLIFGGQTQVLLSGKFEHPRFDLGFVGNGKIRLGNSGWQELGAIVAAGRLEGNILTVDRATADGKLMGLAVRGQVDIVEQSLNLEWDARGFDVDQFVSTISEVHVGGLGYAQGTIAGSFDQPIVAGKIQVFDIENEYIEIPYITADVSFGDGQFLASHLDAKSGMGNVEGELTFNLDTQEINGRFSGADIFLQDIKVLTGKDVVGRIQIDNATISGTLEKPTATASLFSNDLLAFGTRVDHVEANISFAEGIARVTDGIANIQQGVLTFDSQLDIELQKLAGNIEAKALPLERAPISRATLTVAGNLDGMGSFQYDLEAQKGDGEFDGFLDGLQVNGFDIGSGSVNAKLAENLATASANVGSIQGYVELSEAAFRLDTKEWRAKMVADGLGFSQVWVSAREKADIQNAELSRLLAGLDASLGVEVIASGTDSKYQIDVPTLHAKNITSLGSHLGDLDLVGSISPESWDLQSLTWKSDEGSITARGSRKADDSISGQLDINNFDPVILAKFDESWPAINGNLGLTAEISGTVKDPQGQFSLSVADIAVPDKSGQIKKVPVTFNASGELLDRVVSIDNGQVAFQGLSGAFDARIPLDVMEDGEGENATLQLNFTERSLSDLSEYFEVLDVKRSQGKIAGNLRAGGRKGNWEINGDITLSGDTEGKATIAFVNGDTVYENVAVYVQSQGENVNISGTARSNLGGEAQISGTVDLLPIFSGQITDPSFADIPISASLKVKDFNISERIRLTGVLDGKIKSVTSERPTKSSVSGEVIVAGSVATPQISGALSLANLEVNLPSEFPQSQAKERSSVVPFFNDLRITAESDSVMYIPTGDLKLSGTAIIDGPLDELEIIAPLFVEGGTLLLPTTRVRLNEGGSVLVQAGSNVERPRVNVDLTGTTVVTLRRSQTQFQTYTLNLEMRGDLLNPSGANISGTSSPPDLSQEEIRAIVGQQDFLESLANSALGGTTSGLRENLFQLAVPNLTRGLTDSIADVFKLEYLVLDYNPFDGAVARGGTTLFPGLQLEASRQLFKNEFGPTKFELKFNYRVPFKDEFFSRSRFSFGINEQVPWFVGFEYTVRF